MFERRVKLIIESKVNQITPLAKAVRAICSCLIQDELLLYHLELCTVEAVTNVINHSYHRKPGHFVEVIVSLDENQVKIQVIDTGEKGAKIHVKKELDYDPADISTLPESGMGLFLIHKIMDEVIFSDDQEKNIIVMRKQLEKEEVKE